MDFDLSALTAPFRMQPGLARLAPGTAQLTRLDAASALAAERRAVHEAGESRHAVPGFDAGPALRAIADCARLSPDTAAAIDAGLPLELAFQEDFAVLDGATGAVPWLCVCNPSHWAPEDKAGQTLAAIHAPVADNALLQSGTAHLVRLVTGGERWERFVWTLTPSPRYDQHPRRNVRMPWPQADGDAFARRCFLRAERQTFFPVGQGTRQAVFTIRVMLQPLVDAVRNAQQAMRLHDALASMTPAVLAYKNLSAARDRLLPWLALRGAVTPGDGPPPAAGGR